MAICARVFFWFLLWWLQAQPTQAAMAVAPCLASFTRTAVGIVNRTHDEEGNLTQDGLWSYMWDGHCRLIQMESVAAVSAAPRMKLRFTYDAQSRRIRKQVWQETWTAQSSVRIYTLKSDRRFLYDGWNVIAEIDPDGTPARDSKGAKAPLAKGQRGAGPWSPRIDRHFPNLWCPNPVTGGIHQIGGCALVRLGIR